MTKEQLTERADAYARKVAESYITDKKIAYDRAFRDYLAGANSVNEEVEHLEKIRAHLIAERDALIDECDKLRDTWHSPDELPEEDPKHKGHSIPVLGYMGCGVYLELTASIEERVWFHEIYTSDPPERWTHILNNE